MTRDKTTVLCLMCGSRLARGTRSLGSWVAQPQGMAAPQTPTGLSIIRVARSE